MSKHYEKFLLIEPFEIEYRKTETNQFVRNKKTGQKDSSFFKKQQIFQKIVFTNKRNVSMKSLNFRRFSKKNTRTSSTNDIHLIFLNLRQKEFSISQKSFLNRTNFFVFRRELFKNDESIRENVRKSDTNCVDVFNFFVVNSDSSIQKFQNPNISKTTVKNDTQNLHTIEMQ